LERRTHPSWGFCQPLNPSSSDQPEIPGTPEELPVDRAVGRQPRLQRESCPPPMPMTEAVRSGYRPRVAASLDSHQPELGIPSDPASAICLTVWWLSTS